jgi:acyl-CoA synthetase (AMP-forming)/AMP-acid ligase II
LANAIGHHGWLLRRYHQNIYVPVEIDYETGEVVRDSVTGYVQRNSYGRGGEIIVAVANEAAFLGYHKNPEATAKRFLRDVFRKGDLYYRCGDALRRTDDGRWFFLDRLGDTFRWKSENVSTAEVSEVLGRFLGVIDANVFGVELPHHDGRAGCAALLLDSDAMRVFDLDGLLK